MSTDANCVTRIASNFSWTLFRSHVEYDLTSLVLSLFAFATASSWNASTKKVSCGSLVDCWSCKLGWNVTISYIYWSSCTSFWGIPPSCTAYVNGIACSHTHSFSTSRISTCDDTITKLTPINGINGTQSVLFLVFFGHWRCAIDSFSSSFMYSNVV